MADNRLDAPAFGAILPYPFFFARAMATRMQHRAQIRPGRYPARNKAATDVPPETRE